MEKGKRIKMVAIVAGVAMAMGAMTLRAQIFLTEEELERSVRSEATEFTVPVPYQGTDIDQFEHTPLGGGTLLLAMGAGAYLLAKRKKQ